MNTATNIVAGIFAGIFIAAAAPAQTSSVRDTATAYGARLNAKGLPANINQLRANNRIPNRLDTRLALRIERYRPDNTENPTSAYNAQSQQNDNSRTAPVSAAPVSQDGTGQ